ncbi:MAG: hypothetical protein IPM17_11015 [Verrucomicrobia bacterium]|nr:hypothetical protein [Verrucomicrobiota bacterium]
MDPNSGRTTANDLALRLLTGTIPELGRGPRAGVKSVSELDAALAAVAGVPPANREVLRALVLLWHDHWDLAHGAVQELASEDAAYVHGIAHRREPDYWNAKYWFRRVTAHRIWPDLAGEARARREAVPEFKAFDFGGSPGRWEPLAFVDFVEAAARRPAEDPQPRFARDLQAVEMRLLCRHLAGQ